MVDPLDAQNSIERAIEALDNNDLVALQRYLQEGGDVDARTRDEDGSTLLMMACNSGHRNAVYALLAGGADPNAFAPDGRTPLIEAVSKEDITIVRVLLSAGADPNAITTDNETALTYSIVYRQVKLCEVLLAAGANANDTRYDYPPLAEALESSYGSKPPRRKIVRALIQHGADTDYRGRFESILESALRNDDEKLALLVLTTCTRINDPDKKGRRPLTIAKELGRGRVVHRLEAMGAVE